MMVERYNCLLKEAQDAFASGDLEGALHHFEAAKKLASDSNDIDRAAGVLTILRESGALEMFSATGPAGSASLGGGTAARGRRR